MSGRIALLMFGCVVAMGVASAQEPGTAARRARVIAAADEGASGIPALDRGLSDESALVRRAAVRGLAALGAPAKPILIGGLDNSDYIVRRAALMALVSMSPVSDALVYMEKALLDADPDLRALSSKLLASIRPDDAAMSAPFSEPLRDVVPVRDRPDMADHLERIVVLQTAPLPSAGWRLSRDLLRDGHVKNWFASEFDDSSWNTATIGYAWEMEHVGVAWYRFGFDAPARPEKHLAVELIFEGVDEGAWVWLNGVYVGGQDIGPAGWNKPFRLDVTDALRWGGRNQLAVRVLNSMGAGGIWRPVTLEILDFK